MDPKFQVIQEKEIEAENPSNILQNFTNSLIPQSARNICN